MDIAKLGFEINSAPATKAASDLDKMTAAAARAESGTDKMAKKIQREMDEMNRAIQNATGFVKGFVGALASIQTVRALASMADTWSDLTSRVQIAIGAHGNAAAVMDRLAVISRQTYSSLELTADTFTRNALTLNALGKSTKQQLDYAQALNNALVTSGAKGQQAVLVQNALARAMAEGAAKGDDLNLILNYGSRVAEVLADELGVNVTQLRKLAADGKITGSIIFDSLVKNMVLLTEQAESMPATIGDAFTLMRNAVLQTVGVFDKHNKLSESVAEKLIVIADNMNMVIGATVMLAKTLAILWTAKLVSGASIYAYQLAQTFIQTTKNTASAVAYSRAELVSAKATEAATAATLAKMQAMRAAGLQVAGLTAAETAYAAALQRTTAATAGLAAAQAAQSRTFLASLGASTVASVKSIGIVKSAFGIAAAFFAGLEIGKWLRKEFLEVERFGIAMVGGLLKAWERLKAFGVAAWEGIKAAALGAVNVIRDAAASLIGALATANEATDPFGIKSGITDRLREMEQQLRPTTSAWDGFKEALGGVLITMAANERAIDDTMMEMWDYAEAQRNAAGAAVEAETASADLASVIADVGDVAGKAADEAQALADAQEFLIRSYYEQQAAISPLHSVLSDYELAMHDAAKKAAELRKAGIAVGTVDAWLKGQIEMVTNARNKGVSAVERDIAAKERERNVLGRLREDYETQIKLVDMTETQRRAEMVALQAIADHREKHEGVIDAETDALIRQEAAMSEALLAAKELANIAFEDALGPEALGIFRTIDAIKVLRDELDKASGDEAERLKEQIGTLNLRLANDTVGAMMQVTAAMAGIFEEGSKGQKRMEQATAALAVVQAGLATVDAVRAVLSAAQAPWPLNFASMAAMAAAVAPLLSAVGAALPAFGGGGGGTNSAAYRQEHQGTGSILGDSTAKSESILRAVEITANATQQLVGINRGMLTALQAMQAGISGASGLLARGGRGADTSLGTGGIGVLGNILTGVPIVGSLLGGALSNIFGGKESLRDQGIRIVGGTLSSMIDDILVQSFASIHRSGGWFRSSRDYDRFTDLGDDVARQFQMVLGSMADAVRAASEALGLDMDQINAAIAQFRIEEVRISTMGLGAEDAQKEIEAVFGKIFDGLAGHVVPWVGQFQRVGEGLAETLIRVATGVQVTQEALRQLGFSLDEMDPERFAQASEHLMTLMGGVDEFISGMSSFVQNFATDEHKFAVAQDALTRAFEQFGLAVPGTRDEMWSLMQTLDATTEAGREQIAMLLQLAGVSDSYYQMLEQQASIQQRVVELLEGNAWGLYLDGLTDSQRAIAELTRQYDDMRDSLIANAATSAQLAQLEEQRAMAMGRLLAAQAEAQARTEVEYQSIAQRLSDQLAVAQGASEYRQELMRIGREYDANVASLNEAARAAGMAAASETDLARAMQLATIARSKALAALLAEAQALANELYGTPLSRIDDQIAMLQEQESAATAALSGFTDAITDAGRAAAEAMGLLLGSYSPLRASDKLPIALQALARGETDANTVLGIARDVFSSGRAYNQIFDQVQAIVSAQRGVETAGATSAYAGSAQMSEEMRALMAERDRLLAEQQSAQRFTQASQLAGLLADLAMARGEGYDVVAEALGFTLEQFASDLRLGGIDDLTTYLSGLTAEQNSIAMLFDLPTAGDLAIIDAIEAIGRNGLDGVSPVTDPIPVAVMTDSASTQRDEQQAADTREVRDLLRILIDKGIRASEDTATASERVAEGVERLAEILESDDASGAARERRGGA